VNYGKKIRRCGRIYRKYTEDMEEIRKLRGEIHELRKSHGDLTKIVKGILKDLGGLSSLPAWIRGNIRHNRGWGEEIEGEQHS
jgi:hypothetical protein